MNSETILLRQVHPNFLKNGYVSSQAFIPTAKDDKKLSVYDGDLISPADAFAHYVHKLGLKSVGVWGIKKLEVDITGLNAIPDPLPETPEHALVNFQKFSNKQCEKLGKKLRDFAVERGALFSQGLNICTANSDV